MKLFCENIMVRCDYRQNDDRPLRTSTPPTDDTAPSAACAPEPASGAPQTSPLPPTSLFWRGRFYRVQAVEGTWRWRGAWWTTPSLLGLERTYYRVRCAPPGGSELVMELYVERGRWTLSRLLD